MRKLSVGRILCTTALFIMLTISLMPMYIMFATSTKSATEFATNFWGIAWPPKCPSAFPFADNLCRDGIGLSRSRFLPCRVRCRSSSA